MTARIGTTIALRRTRVTLGGQAQIGLAIVLALIVGAAVTHPSLDRIVFIVALLPLAVAVAFQSPRILVFGLVIWLAALGLVRRLFNTISPVKNSTLGDPLLLVEPAVMLVLLAVAYRREFLRERTPLTNAVLVITLLALVETVNPLQGGLLVGLAGLLFLLVPILGFWVGREFVDDRTLAILFLIVVALGVGATMYGLLQQFVGFPSWDQAWISSSGYGALHVGNVIRAFGTFSNSAEYETFLAIGVMVCAAGLTKRRVAPVAIAVGVFLAIGVFYDSTRGIVVLGVAGLGLMFAARHGWSPVPAILGGVAFLFALLLVAGHFTAGQSIPAQGNGALVQHQVNGLADPFNSRVSTLNFHLSNMTRGFRATISNPIGEGSGAISIAATRFGSTTQTTEVDPSNFGVALGVPGFIAYVVVVAAGLSTTYRLAARTRRWWRLAAVGILLATFLEWSTGGQYAVAWLPWLVLGWADGTRVREGLAPGGAAKEGYHDNKGSDRPSPGARTLLPSHRRDGEPGRSSGVTE